MEQAVGRTLSRFGGDPRPATYLKCEAFDFVTARRYVDRCAIFHGFEQCALFSLQRARALGAINVLDQPIIHRTELDRIEREERARMGVPLPARRPFWFQKHVDRKYAEHALTDYAFVPLDFVKRTMVKNGFAPDRVFLIPYAAEPGNYRLIDRPPRPGFNILYVGPLHYWKGLHHLLDLIPKLDIPGARLTDRRPRRARLGALFPAAHRGARRARALRPRRRARRDGRRLRGRGRAGVPVAGGGHRAGLLRGDGDRPSRHHLRRRRRHPRRHRRAVRSAHRHRRLAAGADRARRRSGAAADARGGRRRTGEGVHLGRVPAWDRRRLRGDLGPRAPRTGAAR